MLQCLEHCAAAWQGWSDSGVGWDVNSEHVSSSAIPMSLLFPQGEHKVEQACFHGRIRHLTVKKKPCEQSHRHCEFRLLFVAVCLSPPCSQAEDTLIVPKTQDRVLLPNSLPVLV